MKGLSNCAPISAHFTGTRPEDECVTTAHSSTFPYTFAGIVAAAGCHEVCPGDTSDAHRHSVNPFGLTGWGAPGRASARDSRRTHRHFTRTTGSSCDGGSRVRCESILGAGGAIVSRERDEDCQVPSRRLCLSLRYGAAGPEWRWAPRVPTLALEHCLEQLNARGIPALTGLGRHKSELTHSLPRSRSVSRETPFPPGAVSFAFRRCSVAPNVSRSAAPYGRSALGVGL